MPGSHTRPPLPSRAVSVRAASSVASGAVQAQSSPLYRQARLACKARDYRHAAELLQTLGRTPGLSADAVAYAQAQRDICLRDAGLLPAVPIVASPSAPAPSDADCGPRALLIVCDRLGVKSDLPSLRRMAGATPKGATFAGLQSAAKGLGLSAQGVQASREALLDVQLPAVAWVDRNHYVAVLAMSGNGEGATATIHDPNQPVEETIPQERLLQRCGGFLLLVHR